MDTINLYNLSKDFPLAISESEMNSLTALKSHGWSHCQTKKEWLAKLHYLRRGFKEGRIDKETFLKKEQALVLNWWQKCLA